MSEAVENLSNSVFEKLSTLVNICCRRLRARPAETRAERKPTKTEHPAPSNVIRNMMPPILRMYIVCIRLKLMPSVWYSLEM